MRLIDADKLNDYLNSRFVIIPEENNPQDSEIRFKEVWEIMNQVNQMVNSDVDTEQLTLF